MIRSFVPLGILVSLSVALIQGQCLGKIAHGLGYLLSGGVDATVIENYYRSDATQEWSNGANPLPRLRDLGRVWSRKESPRRIVLMGNSQTFAAVLAPGERNSSAPVYAYADLMEQRLAVEGKSTIYRLSAPNLSYAEALWYVAYLSAVEEARPTDLVIQLNYESFRKSGIRDGMLGLMNEGRFAKVAEQLAARKSLFAVPFDRAIRRFGELERKMKPGLEVTQAARSALPFGQVVDGALRKIIESSTFGANKHAAKADFLTLLYLLRVYALRITPSTPRPLAGAAYEGSVSALDEIASICKTVQIRLHFFLAPQNPKARMWRTEDDRQRYRGAALRLSRNHSVPLVDLETMVPAEQWGEWIDGPDPIHFGIRGHETMAKAMLQSGLF